MAVIIKTEQVPQVFLNRTKQDTEFVPQTQLQNNTVLPYSDFIIDLQDHSNTLTRQRDGARGHQQRLHHILLQDVCDLAFPHVDARVLLSLGMTVP